MTKPLKETLIAGLTKAKQNLKEAQDNLGLGHEEAEEAILDARAFVAEAEKNLRLE